MLSALDAEHDLVASLAGFSRDPLGFVMWAFPWGEPATALATRAGPEPWQVAVLLDIAAGLPVDEAIRVATVSGNGVGKSALVSWVILWATTTHEDTRGIVTANTETQLKTKTWAELGKWYYMFLARELFSLTATALFAAGRERTWRTDMVPWSENNVVAFQGLHNQGKRQFMIFDEASGITDGIWEAADGCMTDAGTERLWLVCGNPNNPTGRFRDCFEGGKYAHRWVQHKVDSRTVSFTDKTEINEWIKAEGQDSDFVRVRVKGEFPRAGGSNFIPRDLALGAQAREVVVHFVDPLVIGVDVARFGDDASVIFFRKGRDAKSIPPIILRGADTMALAGRVAEVAERLRPDAIFVDGTGVGGGVVDRLRQLRVPCLDVQFGAKPDRLGLEGDASIYANKRAEMWGYMREWLRGGSIPDDRALLEELIGPTYYTNEMTGAITLESKKDLRRRGVASPDQADALALTFAQSVLRNDDAGGPHRTGPLVEFEYDPLEFV